VEYVDQFELEFMRRTLKIVQEYDGPLDATLLLNCLLGLLIVPKETSIDKVPDDPIANLARWGISPTSIKQWGIKKGESLPQTIRQLVWSLRNSVAHFNIKPIEQRRVCVGYDFSDASGFHAKITLHELRRFVEILASDLERRLDPTYTHTPDNGGRALGQSSPVVGSESATWVRDLPAGIAEHLGHYVYLYSDPRTGNPFYVGKGVGDRILTHLSDIDDSRKGRTITELLESGLEPRLEILAHGLKDEEAAFRVEAAVIDALSLGTLTNRVRGWRSLQVGRMSLEELVSYYAADPVTIEHPVLIIRINQLFRKGMSKLELYEATRGIWRVGPRRANVHYALATFEGVVREVYEVEEWYPARTLDYQTRDLSKRDAKGRWEFEGHVAPQTIRHQYLHKSVQDHFKRGMRSPTIYVCVPEVD
jgi:hypothetical protein